MNVNDRRITQRWTLVAAILTSRVAFLSGLVINVALAAIKSDRSIIHGGNLQRLIIVSTQLSLSIGMI